MSKIVLLSVNAKYIHSSLAVWVLAAAIATYSKKTHDVQILETTIHKTNEEIAQSIAKHSPEAIGISTYIWNAEKLPEIIARIKQQLPKARIILGGPEAEYNAPYWLSCGADFVLSGEGEQSLPALLDEIAEKNNKLKISPQDRGTDAFLPIDPYTKEYFEALDNRLAYIETSRGCPFSCAFCLSADKRLHYFPLEIVKEQLIKLSQSGIRTIKLVDRTFNSNTQRAYELYEYILGLSTECCFHFEVAADLFDERTITLLQTATPGRIQLEAGLQSFHEPAIKAASRKTDLNLAKENIHKLLKNGNIHIHIDLIAGLPYETLDDFKNSFDKAYLLKTHTLQLGFLKLLHGSKLRNQANALGIKYSRTPPYEIISSAWLSQDEMKILKQTENALKHTANKARFLTTLEYVFLATKIRPFELFYLIGSKAPNHGTDLAVYATQLYEICSKLEGVDTDKLHDYMLFDWMGMVKGKNMPEKIKTTANQRGSIIGIAEEQLGRRIRRDEAVMLLSGKGIYVDSKSRDPVTGLYKVLFAH